MNLQDISVLIDGYNLRLPYATGIKTYGITLLKALNLMGIETNLLWDTPYARNQRVRELLAFDHRKEPTRVKRLQSLIRMALGAQAQFVFDRTRRTVVPPEPFPFFENVSNLYTVPWCYEAANKLYNRFALSTKIRLPGKKLAIWHATYPLPISVKGTIKITTIHDLVPIRFPYTTLDIKPAFYQLLRDCIRESKVIITVSNTTKTDICEVFDLDPDRVCVTYQPVDIRQVSQNLIDIVLQKYSLKRENYILFVGTIEPKKNVGRLIDAYAGLDTDMQLAIVGKKGWLWEGEIGKIEYIFGRRWTKKIKLLDGVPASELSALYVGAYCFAFPSLYEGFGLPVVEAMTLGTPVVCSHISSLSEICGDAAVYVDPLDVASIKRGLEMCLSGTSLRDHLRDKGKEQAKLFNMENYVSRLRAAYEYALGHSPKEGSH